MKKIVVFLIGTLMVLSCVSSKNKKYNKDAKNYKIEQEKLAEKVKVEDEERTKRLNKALTVVLYEKGFDKYNYQEYITYSLAFENKTDKEIIAIKGSITFNDLFDTEIKSVNLKIDQKIPPKETYKGTYNSDYNENINENILLKSKNLDDLKVIWKPEKIIFADGTTLE